MNDYDYRTSDYWLRIEQIHWKTPMGVQSKKDCDRFFNHKSTKTNDNSKTFFGI